MALDSANKRYSAVHVLEPWRGPARFPSGTVDSPARYALALLYSGLQSTSYTLDLNNGSITFAGQSLTANVGVALGAGAVTFAGQSLTTNVGVPLGAGSVTFAGQSVDLVAELDVSLDLDAGAVTFQGQSIELALASQSTKIGGDDIPLRRSPHPGHDKRRAQLKRTEEQKLFAEIRGIYRELTGAPETREAAEAIVEAELPGQLRPAVDDREARSAQLAEQLRTIGRVSVDSEIALRMLRVELDELLEQDDEAMIQQLLAQVL